MGKKKSLIIIIIVFVVLIAGASFLYDQLSEQIKRDALSTEKNKTSEENIESDEQQVAQESVDKNTEDTTEESQTAAPDFTVYDVEGNAYKLSEFKGRPTVVNFWASWCGPCKSEMPDFNEAYLEQGEEIHFLIINMTDGSRETLETASAYIEEQKYQFPVYYDTEYSASMTYGVTSLPTTYFIDAEGYIVAYATGAIDDETLQRGIDMIVTE